MAFPATPIPVDLPGGRHYMLQFISLSNVPNAMAKVGLSPRRCLVITDDHVAALYLATLTTALGAAGWAVKSIILPPGEASKSPRPLQRIYDEALTWGIDRKTPVLALGGGVVGDLAGFAAATMLRGLPLIQLPTTLIAQVDSAIGGKTGINHPVGKNLIGAFHQPRTVCIDQSTLQSLPQREWTSGLAEVIKHALIADKSFFDFLNQCWTALLTRQASEVAEMVHRAAAIKAEVVSRDEFEQGRRAILNFGHTFGHAIERVAGYGHFTHGEAVALGMKAALYLSQNLFPDFQMEPALSLVRGLPLPKIPAIMSVDDLLQAMQTDKKVEAGSLHFVVLRRLGEALVTGEAPLESVRDAWVFALSD